MLDRLKCKLRYGTVDKEEREHDYSVNVVSKAKFEVDGTTRLT